MAPGAAPAASHWSDLQARNRALQPLLRRVGFTRQFDAMIHIDRTHAIEPLEWTAEWEQGVGLPETYPFAGELIPGQKSA